ncbi:MAG: hypothetical protein WKG07_15795 [Hymenobacter sp.]
MAAAPVDTLRKLAQHEFGATALQPVRLPFRPATEPGNAVARPVVISGPSAACAGYYDTADKYEVERLITEINVLLYTDDHHD